MQKRDRQKFFAEYKAQFGSLTQPQVDALNELLSLFEQSDKWNDLRHCAYAFATIKHETAHTFRPITEYGADAYFKKYDGRADLGNNQPGDGLRFKGRGFSQITGRANYTRFAKLLGVDLVGNPKLALQPAIAFKILTLGMYQGLFTGKKLADYINDTVCDYVSARRIINRLDKAQTIANYAKRFFIVLRKSKVGNSLANISDQEIETIFNESPNSHTESQPETSESLNQREAFEPDSFTPEASSHAPPQVTPTVTVEQVKPSQEEKQDVSGIKAYWAAISTFVTANVAAIGHWAMGADIRIIAILVGIGLVCGMLWFISRYIFANAEKRREHELIKEREARAHEIQMALIQSAADPNKLTVHVQPNVIRSSDDAP